MLLLVLLLFILFMFSGGGYYGYRRGMYGRSMGYGGIALGWLVFLFVILFMMPRWGFVTAW